MRSLRAVPRVREARPGRESPAQEPADLSEDLIARERFDLPPVIIGNARLDLGTPRRLDIAFVARLERFDQRQREAGTFLVRQRPGLLLEFCKVGCHRSSRPFGGGADSLDRATPGGQELAPRRRTGTVDRPVALELCSA